MKEHLITVGPERADFIGTDAQTIQSAIEKAASLGGGTVRLAAGTYLLRNAIHLRTGVKLAGVGPETVLKKTPSARTQLIDDTDWYESRATVADPQYFQPGDGLILQSQVVDGNPARTTKHTVLEIKGHELLLDKQPRTDHWVSTGASAARLFPIVTANYATDLAVEDLTIDGNRAENEYLNGNYGGGLFFQDCERIALRNLIIRDFNGDGISWQVCHDVLVEKCHLTHCTSAGLHPGSGSQRPVIRENLVEHCATGIYWCWGVRHGIAENNRFQFAREAISIGHRDTDNRIRGNHIEECTDAGISFRSEPSEEWLPHRTTIEGNTIVNIGTARQYGVGIQLRPGLRDIAIVCNEIRDTRGYLREAIETPGPLPGLKNEGNTVQRPGH